MKSFALSLGLMLSFSATADVITVPLKGALEARVSIDKGGTKDHLSEIEGSTLVLGEARCTIKGGKCTLEGVTAGPHFPGAFLTSSTPKINYRLLTGKGAMIQIKAEPSGMVVLPEKKRVVIFHVERYDDDEYAPPAAPPQVAGISFDTTVTFDVWVRLLTSEQDDRPFEREAQGDELKGTLLRLGRATCAVKENHCTFGNVQAGEFNIEAKFTPTDGAKYSLMDSPAIKIELDPWTHRPTVKGWKKNPVVTIEKITRNPHSGPVGR